MTRLKSLELQGYKTFASRNAFEFPAQITAIVGPNGAGKSNIADALRWVLGEQAYSMLRARRTEDMIFAGSEQRARASMAACTILFDNEDGWIPIDFSEVSITRRAYRDGDNEYLLNGQRVRLKEISELLARSGLGERTYTIIGQGLVDAALSLKPDERRRFFEEAAGIGLYRSRREESLSRLEATQRNLDRVLDIISELEPRLASLERQARRARDYERIQADLRELLRDWYGYHWHHGQEEVVHARQVVQVQEERQKAARERLLQVEEEMENARAQVQDLRASLGNWHNESARLHNQHEGISRRLAVLDERQRAQQEQHANLQNELARLEEEQAAQVARLQALEEEELLQKHDLSEAQARLQAAQQTLAERQAERQKTGEALRIARLALVEAETGQVRQRAHLDELNGRCEVLQRSKDALQQSMENESNALTAAQALLDESAQKHKNAEDRAKELEQNLQSRRDDVRGLENRRKEILETRARLEAETLRLKTQLDVLEQAEKSFSGLNQGARYLLEAARTGKLPAGCQALNSLLETPAGYEHAIAAVLGDYMDGILLENSTDPENLLVLLEEGENGRAVIFTAGIKPISKPLTVKKSAEVLGIASTLVKAPQNLENLVETLLGHAVVVRDRATARRLLPELPTTARVVTLKGEVFTGNGVVIAGQDGRSSMISRPRQKRELQTALLEAENELKKTEGSVVSCDKELAKAQKLELQLEAELQTARQETIRTAREQQHASLALQQARQRSEWQHTQLETTTQQLEKAIQEMERIRGELEILAQKTATHNEQVQILNRTLAGLPLDEVQAEAAHWSTNTAVASRALQEASRRLEEHRQSITSAQQQHTLTRQRLAIATTALQELKTEKESLHAQEAELNKSLESLQAQIDPAEKQLQTLETQYEFTLTGQASAQQAVTVAERYLAQAQMDLTRHREVLDNLRRRVEDDFGLVAFEYTPSVSGPTPLPFSEMVEELPPISQLPADLEENINRQRALLRRMGAVNLEAQVEYQEVQERFTFLSSQVNDLKKADQDLRRVIAELDELMQKEFRRTFEAVAVEFRQMFTRLFGGGSARLVLLENEDDPSDAGIEIEARLPGRREQGLALLSGGERSLTAVALIFSLLKVSPTPFCVLDEVDAMLDESNVGRFCELLDELSQTTQFIVITHNRNTVQTSDVIYGITMGRDSASQVISLKLDEVSEDMVR